MQRTRRIILDILKRQGRATLDQLAQELGVVSMTVRGHLSVLERDGLVGYEEERGKVGRPRFVYFLTPEAQEQFPKSYDTLCNRILDVIKATQCDVSTGELAERVAEAWTSDRIERMADKTFDERVQTMAVIRTEEGAMASCHRTADGYILEQCHCPASCVAQRHPEIVCAAELSYIKRAVGAPVERVNWRVEGSETCSYFIKRPCKDDEPPPRDSLK